MEGEKGGWKNMEGGREGGDSRGKEKGGEVEVGWRGEGVN